MDTCIVNCKERPGAPEVHRLTTNYLTGEQNVDKIASDYYASERRGAVYCFGFALLAIGLSIRLMKTGIDFTEGIGRAMLVLCGLILVASGAYWTSLGKRQAQCTVLLETDQLQFVLEESNHIARAASSLRLVVLAEMSLALGGTVVVILGQIWPVGAIRGMGIGLTAIALLLAFYDSENRERALKYKERLRKFHV